MQPCTRFAPSPTGLLHVGNAYSALCCAQWAKRHRADFLLRIEDIDHMRCKPVYVQHIMDDLAWLGLTWQAPIRYQSRCLPAYQQGIEQLHAMQLIYPCFCSRKAIQTEILRISSAPHVGENIATYPGTCRHIPTSQQQRRMQHEAFCWRLDVRKALASLDQPLYWHDEIGDQHAVQYMSDGCDHDVVIGRKDIGFSYHLAVVVDDAAQAVTHIIRGEDLRASTAIHRLLQVLLGLPEPIYEHHALLCNQKGERLAKRNGAISLQSLRQMGVKADQLCAFLATLDAPVWPFEADQKTAIVRALGKMG